MLKISWIYESSDPLNEFKFGLTVCPGKKYSVYTHQGQEKIKTNRSRNLEQDFQTIYAQGVKILIWFIYLN